MINVSGNRLAPTHRWKPVTSINDDQNLWCHLALVGHNELNRIETWNSEGHCTQNMGPIEVCRFIHYDDVIMGRIASQITSLTIVYLALYSGADQSKHQSSASLAFVWRIHRGPVNSPHKWPVTRKMSPFDDVIMFNTLKLEQNSGRFTDGILKYILIK